MADHMTAQQQLADAINARGFDAPIIALRVIRDHGPALVELIESARKLTDGVSEREPERPETWNHDDPRDWAADWESWYTASQLRVPLKKLTEPK